MTPSRVGCVVNPASGSGDGERMAAELSSLFPTADVNRSVTRGPEDVGRATRDQLDTDLLVVVGGDGTVREVAETLASVDRGDGPPLFVVPAGRGNSSYRQFYGEAGWRETARALATGVEPWPVDLGTVAAEPAVDAERFVLGVTVGLFRAALRGAEEFRLLPGPAAYVLGTARAALGTDPTTVTVRADGERVFEGDARLVAVGGGRYRGGAFRLLPDARPAAGDLRLLVVEPTGLREAVTVARMARDGAHTAHDAVHYHAAETVTVRSGGPLPAEADGTPLSPGPRELRLGVEPGGLTLARPG